MGDMPGRLLLHSLSCLLLLMICGFFTTQLFSYMHAQSVHHMRVRIQDLVVLLHMHITLQGITAFQCNMWVLCDTCCTYRLCVSAAVQPPYNGIVVVTEQNIGLCWIQQEYSQLHWLSFVYMHAQSISIDHKRVRKGDSVTMMVLLFIALHMQAYTAGHHCIPALWFTRRFTRGIQGDV
jgi:hypothetical protein